MKSPLILLCVVLVACAGSVSLASPTILGDYTMAFNGVTYRAVDDECIYYVDMQVHNANHPGVALPDPRKTIAANYDPDAIPDPVVPRRWFRNILLLLRFADRWDGRSAASAGRGVIQ